MATHVGTSGVVKVGANAVAEVTGFTIDETNDTVEDTTLTDTAKSYIALRKDATGTIECHWDETDTTGQGALTVGASVTLNLYPEGADSADTYYTGTALVTGVSQNVSLDGVIARTITVQFSGGVSTTTV
ncbi:phage major tail protein 2 [uncultured Mediterranean phage uvMED]|nr:phage major tail protein 2 [uncultured Mediterranean phage uvMED]